MNRLDKLIVTLCALGALLCFARIARGQSLYVDSIPVPNQECQRKAKRVLFFGKSNYVVSVAALTAAHVADTHSSWGREELHPLLRSADGRFGVKGLAVKSSLVAGHLTVQTLILRKWPQARRAAAVLNFALAGIVGVIAVRNYRR